MKNKNNMFIQFGYIKPEINPDTGFASVNKKPLSEQNTGDFMVYIE